MDNALPLNRFSKVDLNKLIIGLVSGLIAGLVAGIGARLAMRFVAILGGLTTDFTFGGTLFIVILGAFSGIIFGLIFMAIGLFIRGNVILRGLIYGIALAVLLVLIPFLSAPGGELSLISPAEGIALFAPIPIAYGLILGVLIDRFSYQKSFTSRHIRVHIAWLFLFGFGLILLLMNANTLMSENFPLPGITRQFNWTAEMSKSALRELHGFVIIGFIAVYALLVGLLVIFGNGKAKAFLTAAALLAFGAAFFGNGTIFSGPMRSITIIRYIPSLITTIGFMALILLMYLFPNGRFNPGWTKPLAIFWLLFAVVWFFDLASTNLIAIHLWPEWLQLFMMVGALVTGIAAQVARYHQLESEERFAHRWALIGFAITTLTFTILWITILIAPELKARVSPRLDYLVAFAFGPYLFIWLLLPAALILTIRAQEINESSNTL